MCSQIKKLSSLCKLVFFHSCDDQFLKKKYLHSVYHSVPDVFLQELIRECSEAHSAYFNDCILTILAQPALSVLELRNCPLTVTNHFLCRTLAGEQFSGLHTFILTECSHLTDVDLVLDTIARTCQDNLTSVNLSGCQTVTDEGVKNLTRQCSQLQLLNLSDCLQLQWTFLHHLNRRGGIAKRLGQLEELSVGCNPQRNYLTDQMLGMMLRELVVAEAGSCPTFRRLQTLDLHGHQLQVCDNYTLQVLCSYGQSLAQLNLDDSGICDTGLLSLLSTCRSIFSLSLLGENCLTLSSFSCCLELPQLNELKISLNKDTEGSMEFQCPSLPKRSGSWKCEHCTFENTNTRVRVCEACFQKERSRECSDEVNEDCKLESENKINTCHQKSLLRDLTFSVAGFADGNDSFWNWILELLPQSLISLDFSRISFKLDAEVVIQILCKCTSLRMFSLPIICDELSQANKVLDYESLAPFLSELTSLQAVMHSSSPALNFQQQMTHLVLKCIEVPLPIVVSSSSLRSLEIQIANLPSTTHLDLTGCPSLSSLKVDCSGITNIYTAGSIEELHVSGDVHDDFFNEVLYNNLAIRNFRLNSRIFLGKTFHKTLQAAWSSLHFLETMEFEGCSVNFCNFSTACEFSGGCPSFLAALVIIGAESLTNADINTIAHDLPQLRKLTIDNCESLVQLSEIKAKKKDRSANLGSPSKSLKPLPEAEVLEGKRTDSFVDYLREKFKRILLEDDGQVFLFPASLDSRQRKLVHDLSEEFGFHHKSFEQQSQRHIKVWKGSEDPSQIEALDLFDDDELKSVFSEDQINHLLQSSVAHYGSPDHDYHIGPLIKIAKQLPREKLDTGAGRHYCIRFQRKCCPYSSQECNYAHFSIASNKLQRFKPLLDFVCRVKSYQLNKPTTKDNTLLQDTTNQDSHNGFETSSHPTPLVFPKLETLEIVGCKRLGSIFLDAPRLLTFSCLHCKKLSTMDINLPVAVNIDLSGCSHLADFPLHLKSFKRLQKAVLNGCKQLQQQFMDQFVVHCQNLQRLEICNTGAALAATNPALSAHQAASFPKEKVSLDKRIKTKTATKLKSMNMNRPNLEIFYTKRQFSQL